MSIICSEINEPVKSLSCTNFAQNVSLEKSRTDHANLSKLLPFQSLDLFSEFPLSAGEGKRNWGFFSKVADFSIFKQVLVILPWIFPNQLTAIGKLCCLKKNPRYTPVPIFFILMSHEYDTGTEDDSFTQNLLNHRKTEQSNKSYKFLYH